MENDGKMENGCSHGLLCHQNSVMNSVSYKIGRLLVDPGDEWGGFQDVSAVLLTHGHYDHIYGLNRVLELNPEAIVITNTSGAQMLADSRLNLSKYHDEPFEFRYPDSIRIVKEGDKLEIDEKTVEVYETPGHHPSCLTYIVNSEVFSGDSYIPGIKTVTNLPGGSAELAQKSRVRIVKLAEGKGLNPGHPRLKLLSADRRPI